MARTITPDSLRNIEEDSGESESDVDPVHKKYDYRTEMQKKKEQKKLPYHYKANKDYDPDKAALAYWKNNMKTKEYIEWELKELERAQREKKRTLLQLNKVMKTPKKSPKMKP